MILSQTLARAQERRRAVNKPQFNGTVVDLIGTGLAASERCDEPTPQAFLVEQPPHWNLQTHFHQRHQFQVVVRGSGPEGVSYLTLRVVSDTGAWYLPDARQHLKLRIPKQQLHAAPSSSVDADGLRALVRPQQETLIEPDAGGLAAWLLRLPPGAQVDAPAGAPAGAGRYYVVSQGSLRVADDDLEGLAIVYAGREDALVLQAGAAGAEVLVLQFPASALQPLPQAA